MSKNKKAKGKTLTDLDEPIRSIDGEPVWRGRETLMGMPILPRDKDGQPTGETPKQEMLTRRKAILYAMAVETKEQASDADAKLRAGHLQVAFWSVSTVKVDAEDITFIKERLNNRWNGVIYTIMDDYLEGVETLQVETESSDAK
ncbi:hypothetical protein LCGC14_2098250 [marine sediment metagenome]|uniref:Uncharacterized protein n=1 Tax=marine sediment metagenome TaxID=412755 RepID=A0A0F9GNX7_9ZZZZ